MVWLSVGYLSSFGYHRWFIILITIFGYEPNLGDWLMNPWLFSLFFSQSFGFFGDISPEISP
jgi:hypothetical protein